MCTACYTSGVDDKALIGLLRDELGRRPGIRFAVLFGSAARRGPAAARDVDVALSLAWSPSLFEMAELAIALERRVGKEVDVVDVSEQSTLMQWEILRDGKLVIAPDANAWRSFQARVPIDHADLCLLTERQRDGLGRALGV